MPSFTSVAVLYPKNKLGRTSLSLHQQLRGQKLSVGIRSI